MKRRTFLQAAAVTAVSWPTWLRRAFADATVELPGTTKATTGDPAAPLATALERARRAGKPLLVLVIPKEAEKWDRGTAFGAWINHGSDGEMAPLALCEVVCASIAELRQLDLYTGNGEPLMLLVETDPGDRRTSVLDGELPQYKDTWNDEEGYVEKKITDARINLLVGKLSAALGRDAAAIARRAAWARKSLDAATVAALDAGVLAVPPGSPVLVDRGAALVLERARGAPMTALLARAATARLRERRVPGSHWARASSCGPAEVEGVQRDDDHVYGCGMGHIPERSRRFLYFYAIKDKPR